MFIEEVILTSEEEEIVFRVRQLIGDEKEVFVDDTYAGTSCGGGEVLASGTMYKLQEPKGYPLEVYVGGQEYTTSGNPTVLGYKFLKFASPVLVSGAKITVVYEHFKHSDLEIIDTYDSGALTYLTAQCNLSIEELGIDLLVLSTAYILLTKDLSVYVQSAVELQDSDSKYNASTRPNGLKDLLKMIQDQLKGAIEAKTKCKMLYLPVYKVE
jgi:hypothetical protein